MSSRERELGESGKTCQLPGMSLSEIQAQASVLNSEERRKLAAFLTFLRMKETGEWDEATSQDTRDRTGWISLDEAKCRLLPQK
jgi:hypothetical protein